MRRKSDTTTYRVIGVLDLHSWEPTEFDKDAGTRSYHYSDHKSLESALKYIARQRTSTLDNMRHLWDSWVTYEVWSHRNHHKRLVATIAPWTGSSTEWHEEAKAEHVGGYDS